MLIRGMAWDHVRGRAPLEAASREWIKLHPDVAINWHARPLKDFEDFPLDRLVDEFDLVLIDHPFVGTAANSGLLVPFDEFVSDTYLEDQQRNSVGPSFSSYTWGQHQWALAIDAAAQVSATRSDLIDVDRVPETWDEVARLAAEVPGRVAAALNPNHSYCAFVSVGVANFGTNFWDHRSVSEGAPEALDFLKRLTRNIHPISREADPIILSDHMTTTDEIWYCPLMFGYSNYSRASFRPHPLLFGNAPIGAVMRGSVLGGVGLAVSASSEAAAAAGEFAIYVASGGFQRTTYFHAGGQPGHLQAWRDPELNAACGSFFARTLETMDAAFMRPRVSGHRRFQEFAGELVHTFLWKNNELSTTDCVARFNQLCAVYLAPDSGAEIA